MSAIEIQNVIAGVGFYTYESVPAREFTFGSPGVGFARLGVGDVEIRCTGWNPLPTLGNPPTAEELARVRSWFVLSVFNEDTSVELGAPSVTDGRTLRLKFKSGSPVAPRDVPFSILFINW